LDGAAHISDYIKLAKEYGHPSLALTDHGNMSGTFELHEKCKKAGIKPIIGMEAYLNDNMDKTEEKKYEGSDTHQVILVKDKIGFENLSKLTYLSFSEGYYRRGRITTEWLLENKKGLIVTTSCLANKLARLLEEGKESEAEERIKMFKREFGDDFYAELQFNEVEQQKKYNHFILKMIKKHDLCPIITNDVHYAYPEDNRLQDVLIAINQGKIVDQPGTFKLDARHLYYPSVADLHDFNKKFGYNYPEHFVDMAIENTVKVAEKCNFEFETNVEKYPRYEPTKEVVEYFKTEDSTEIITKLAHAKLKQKLKQYEKNGLVKITPEKIKEYEDRLSYELQVIGDKKMLDYFLVVWELIRFCKENTIMVGPGRGSAAGCLLTWCLEITKIDPIRFDLYFERFLNKSRKGPPDLDIDFEAGTDQKTLEFLINKYGKDRVFSVVTFGTFNEKGCIKDVTRAMGYDAGFDSDVFAVTQEMPKKPSWDISLEEWFRDYPKTKECSDRVRQWLNDPKNAEIKKLTLKLQGQIRNLGKHAAGIVITPDVIWKYIPVNITKGDIVTAFQESGSGKDLSDLGILKLDRLKLETLNVIKLTIKLVKEKKHIDIQEKIDFIDLYDESLYSELLLGNNQGIFQFESEGITRLAKDIKVESFDEVVAVSALYRPGPMGIGAHDEYIRNKFFPEKREYPHQSLVPLLEKSNGVLIYQEQLMFIANKIGGMSLGDGDNLRKVMDAANKIIKKKTDGEKLTEQEEEDKNYKKYKELWSKFLDGAKKNGLSEIEVSNIEGWLIKYLGYSFNKCLTKNHDIISKNRGIIKINNVVENEEILCYNEKECKNEYKKVKKIHINGIKKIYKIKTASGKILECTLDHKILTNYGMKTLEEIINDKLKLKDNKEFESIVSIECIGDHETMDLEIDSEFHNFYANDICVSNSHSVSYSYITAQTLFLRHYYPAEFYTALLNHQKSNSDKDKERRWLSSAILAALSKGINIIPPTRKSKWEWTMIDDKTIAMGLSGIDGLGDKAYQELQEARLENMTKEDFFSYKFSKFNKRSFENCVKAGLFDDWSQSRNELIELRTKKVKITKQLDIFGKSANSIDDYTGDKKFESTGQDQKYREFLEVCKLDLKILNRISSVKKMFFDEYKIQIESAINYEDQNNFYYFLLERIEERTGKMGKKFYSIHISDGIITKKITMWDDHYKKIQNILVPGHFYITKFIKENGWLSFSKSSPFRQID
jgi:DNA-directed DNA polymerase III PolC